MKILTIAGAILLLAFTTVKVIDNNKAQATVNQEQGLFLFVDCKPIAEYELIGTLKSQLVNMDTKSLENYPLSYNQLKEDIFRLFNQKKNKEKFRGAQAVIIYPEQQKADFIKFKQ